MNTTFYISLILIAGIIFWWLPRYGAHSLIISRLTESVFDFVELLLATSAQEQTTNHLDEDLSNARVIVKSDLITNSTLIV